MMNLLNEINLVGSTGIKPPKKPVIYAVARRCCAAGFPISAAWISFSNPNDRCIGDTSFSKMLDNSKSASDRTELSPCEIILK